MFNVPSFFVVSHTYSVSLGMLMSSAEQYKGIDNYLSRCFAIPEDLHLLLDIQKKLWYRLVDIYRPS